MTFETMTVPKDTDKDSGENLELISPCMQTINEAPICPPPPPLKRNPRAFHCPKIIEAKKPFKCPIVHFVYVIGLHAVQFGNNWMRKILRTAKIGRGRRPNQIWQSEEFFESNYFQIGQECSPVTY